MAIQKPPGGYLNSGDMLLAQASMNKPKLSVNDVERLAKAGVQVKLEDILDRVHPDAPPKPTHNNPLVMLLFERLRMVEKAKPENIQRDRYTWGHPDLYASRFEDKVYVFVATGKSEPMIIEDEACLYPSDALLAKLNLLENAEQGKRRVGTTVERGVFGS